MLEAAGVGMMPGTPFQLNDDALRRMADLVFDAYAAAICASWTSRGRCCKFLGGSQRETEARAP